MTTFTCPICETIYETELPDDIKTMLPIHTYQEIEVCETCLPKLIESVREKQEEKKTTLIKLAKTKK